MSKRYCPYFDENRSLCDDGECYACKYYKYVSNETDDKQRRD